MSCRGCRRAGDVSEWLDAGGSVAALRALCAAAPPWRPQDDGAAADVTGDLLLPYCEEALTLLGFTERHHEDLRYCEAFGRWFEWDNGRWREDVRRRVFTHAREHCRERSAAALHDIEDEKAAARVAAVVASAKVVAAVVGLARADVRHATAPEDWDADVWALNTPAGIGDLRTGQRFVRTSRTRCARAAELSRQGRRLRADRQQAADRRQSQARPSETRQWRSPSRRRTIPRTSERQRFALLNVPRELFNKALGNAARRSKNQWPASWKMEGEPRVATPQPVPERENLAGPVERVTFHNEDSGFCVLRVTASRL